MEAIVEPKRDGILGDIVRACRVHRQYTLGVFSLYLLRDDAYRLRYTTAPRVGSTIVSMVASAQAIAHHCE